MFWAMAYNSCQYSPGKAMVYSLATRRNSNALSSYEWISGRVYWRGCKITEEGIREASSPGLFCAKGVLARSRGPEDLPGQTTCWVPSTGTMHSASIKTTWMKERNKFSSCEKCTKARGSKIRPLTKRTNAAIIPSPVNLAMNTL
jgi:hypothetical protein